MLRNGLAAVGAIGIMAGLAGCVSHQDVQTPAAQEAREDEAAAQTLYTLAKKAMQSGGFKAAAGTFSSIQEKFPYSNWATKAQLMEAYCRYQAHQYEDAIDAFTIFAHLHPYHQDRPYACYMIGLSHYERISIVERDQEDTTAALKAFQTLLEEYPTCDYAKDAKFKIDFIRNHLAAREMSIGRFYQKNRSYLAAIKRFRTVVTQYQTTEQTPEALLRLAECYAALRMRKELLAMHAVLRRNHPDSVWFKAAQKLVEIKDPVQVKPAVLPAAAPQPFSAAHTAKRARGATDAQSPPPIPRSKRAEQNVPHAVGSKNSDSTSKSSGAPIKPEVMVP